MKNDKKDIKTFTKDKEEDTMAATAKNYVYEVSPQESRKIIAQPAVSKAFLDDCKKAAQKYRKK